MPVKALNNQYVPEEYQLNLYKAKVLTIKDVIVDSIDEDNTITTQIAEVKIYNKEYKGLITEVRSTLTGNPIYDITLKEGQMISVHAELNNDDSISFYVIGYERSNYILQLIIIFLLCLIILGGIKGLKAIIALSITILLILYVLIPLLLKGYNPIVISVVVCAIATLITLTIIAGFNKKSTSAILGTVGGLLIAGIIAFLYGILAKLTGFNSAEAQMLLYLPEQIAFNYKGLLFAGIIIGALGAVMDVSISISSALTEIEKENPKIKINELFNHGMTIGRDIMGTMANTLILAYTGSTLSMLLIFVGFQKTLNEIINLDSVATEILRAIAGSIGLIFAIPITTIAYIFITNFNKKEKIR
jgi:uncharacterized membrane protein